jgi:hypothetical protein
MRSKSLDIDRFVPYPRRDQVAAELARLDRDHKVNIGVNFRILRPVCRWSETGVEPKGSQHDST